MKNKKGFTLIELLAVLVVLAILALISIPITIRIIESARENSYKRSIENYAKTFEKVIAIDSMSNASSDYKALTNYAQDVENMYTGNRVSCDLENSTIENGKVVLRGCQVNNSSKYTYKDNKVTLEPDYMIGDRIKVSNDYYYVIKDSYAKDDYVVALKENPLTTEEVNDYGREHVNRYNWYHLNSSYDINGYGGVELISSDSCGYLTAETVSSFVTTGCFNHYDDSDVEYVVNQWTQEKFQNNELKKVDNYYSRLIRLQELQILGYGTEGRQYINWNEKIPKWVYNSNYYYWTMSLSAIKLWFVHRDGTIRDSATVGEYGGRTIRPVINVYKSTIESSD